MWIFGVEGMHSKASHAPLHTCSIGCSQRNRVKTEAGKKPFPPNSVFIIPKAGQSQESVPGHAFPCADGLVAKGCVPLATSGSSSGAGLLWAGWALPEGQAGRLSCCQPEELAHN